MLVGGRGIGEHVSQAHQLSIEVRHLDTDRGLARDGRQQADVVGRHRVRDVAVQGRDLLDLHAGAELDLVASDCRATGEARDRGVDLELLQDPLDRLDHLIVGLAAFLRRVAGGEKLQRRERVVDPAEQLRLRVQLFAVGVRGGVARRGVGLWHRGGVHCGPVRCRRRRGLLAGGPVGPCGPGTRRTGDGTSGRRCRCRLGGHGRRLGIDIRPRAGNIRTRRRGPGPRSGLGRRGHLHRLPGGGCVRPCRHPATGRTPSCRAIRCRFRIVGSDGL